MVASLSFSLLPADSSARYSNIFKMLRVIELTSLLDINTPSSHNFYRLFDRRHAKFADFDAATLRNNFRMSKRDGRDVMRMYNIGPRPIILRNGSLILPEEAFLIWLFVKLHVKRNHPTISRIKINDLEIRNFHFKNDMLKKRKQGP